MKQPSKTYNLMAMKQRVSLGKTAQKLSKTVQTFQKGQDTQDKLESLLAEKQDVISNISSKFQLQSELWFGTELADQLEIIQSQNILLEREMVSLKKSVAQKEHKFRKISEKADTARRQFLDARQEKQDQADISNKARR